jgi:hypothetical protein
MPNIFFFVYAILPFNIALGNIANHLLYSSLIFGKKNKYSGDPKTGLSGIRMARKPNLLKFGFGW